MHVSVGRVDASLPLPTYGSAGAAGLDLYARCETTVEAGQIARIPTNIIVRVPDAHVLLVALRSSTPGRTGLICPHGVGIIDADYCGPEDEVLVQVLNTGTQPVTIRRGERIAQAILLPLVRVDWVEGPFEREDSRGGFGSTG